MLRRMSRALLDQLDFGSVDKIDRSDIIEYFKTIRDELHVRAPFRHVQRLRLHSEFARSSPCGFPNIGRRARPGRAFFSDRMNARCCDFSPLASLTDKRWSPSSKGCRRV